MISRQMPLYNCHKQVRALKIARIEREEAGGAVIFPEEEEFAPFRVNPDFMNKHQPKAGGYFVAYKDGYISFSPAEAFEEGYTLAST